MLVWALFKGFNTNLLMPNISNFVFLVQNSLITGCSKKYKQENEMKLNTHQYRGHGSAVEVMLWHGPLFFSSPSSSLSLLLLFTFRWIGNTFLQFSSFILLLFLLLYPIFFSAFFRIEETYDDMKNSIFILFNQHVLPFFFLFLKCFFMSLIIHTR